MTDVSGYTELVLRFLQRWAVAARHELGTAAQSAEASGEGQPPVDPLDPDWTETRQRFAMNLTYWPTEFSRLRLQTSRDLPGYRDGVWATFLAIGAGVGSTRIPSLLKDSHAKSFSLSRRSHRLCLLAVALGLLLPTAALARVDVVATTPDLASVATAVGGSRVQVTPLSLPTQDPHWVDARPHLALPPCSCSRAPISKWDGFPPC